MIFAGKTIGFIGSGVMGGAMIGGLVNSHIIAPENILAADPHQERLRELEANFGIRTTGDNVEVAQRADILIISVKPQVIDDILPQQEARDCDLVISIAAGVSIDHLRQVTGNDSIVRSMPNTPAIIGQGVIGWTCTPQVDAERRDYAARILGSLGEQIFIPKEEMMDAVTALSGTGPAYTFLFMEAMIDVGVHMGFSRDIAERLVIQTMRGSVEYALMSKKHPAVLRNEVTSPGGTTAEAMYHLEKGGFRNVVARGVWAAFQRSMGLGGGKKVSEAMGGRNPDAIENDR